MDVLLGFAAGIMLAASFFSLLIPAISLGGVWMAVLGLVVGVLLLHLVDRYVPHAHFILGPEGPSSHLAWVSLLVIAITIHNFPEGLAVGVSFGSGDIRAGMVLATGIGLQNMPEGLAVALPLVLIGYRRLKALGYATLTGLVEPPGALLGLLVVTLASPILPFSLAFAAGAMMFVVADEMIPESHRKGHERPATFGLILGFVIMMLLDTLFG
jgi:ZIP family zinc transporter